MDSAKHNLAGNNVSDSTLGNNVCCKHISHSNRLNDNLSLLLSSLSSLFTLLPVRHLSTTSTATESNSSNTKRNRQSLQSSKAWKIHTIMSASSKPEAETPSKDIPDIRIISNKIFQSAIHIVLAVYYLDRQYICDDRFLNLTLLFFFAFRMYTLWHSYKRDFEGEKRGKGERMWEWGGHDEAYWRMTFLVVWALICIMEMGFLVGGWLIEA